jgi:hypothetical protein
MRPVFIAAHWLPVASIPPSDPPEQSEASTVSIFEVFISALGGGAALAIRLAPCADTVDVAGALDIFAGRRATTGIAGIAIDCWIPLILAVGRGDAISEPFAYAPM